MTGTSGSSRERIQAGVVFLIIGAVGGGVCSLLYAHFQHSAHNEWVAWTAEVVGLMAGASVLVGIGCLIGPWLLAQWESNRLQPQPPENQGNPTHPPITPEQAAAIDAHEHGKH